MKILVAGGAGYIGSHTVYELIDNGLPAEIAARQKQYEYYRDKLLSFEELKK